MPRKRSKFYEHVLWIAGSDLADAVEERERLFFAYGVVFGFGFGILLALLLKALP